MRKAISYWAMRVWIFGVLCLVGLDSVQPVQCLQHRHAIGPIEPGGIIEKQHGIRARAQLDSLMHGGEKTAPPEPGVERLSPRLLGNQDEERGQVPILAAQAVAGPGSHAGTTGELRAGLEERDRRIVVDRLGVHAPDEAELVHDARHVRDELAGPEPRLAVSFEAKLRCRQGQRRLLRRHAREPLPTSHAVGQLLAMEFFQHGLVVEELQLRRRPTLEEVDHPLRTRRQVGGAQNTARVALAGR